MAVVVFVPSDFRATFPQFSKEVDYPDMTLAMAFSAAEMLLDNTDTSQVPYDDSKGISKRQIILYYLTCHILTMNDRAANGQAGPLSSVSEGDVSASFAVSPVMKGSYFLQTPCGQTAWQMLLPYVSGGVTMSPPDYHPWG